MFCLLAFITMQNTVVAEQAYIYLGDVIPDLRLYLKTPTVEKYKNMYEIINRNTGEYVYCIEPGVVLKNGYFTSYEFLSQVDLAYEITDEDWDYLRMIANYGYGYKDRWDIKWYAATQFMIWEYILEGRGEVYFVDGNNRKIDPLAEEIAMIENDLKHHGDVPSFLENDTVMKVHLGDTLTFVDQNQVLDEFQITKSNVDYQVTGNQIQITFDTVGYQTVRFKKKLTSGSIPKIYYSPANQTVINRGVIDTPYEVLEFEVLPSFSLIKTSDEASPLSLAGAKYGIYDEQDQLYAEVVTNEDGYAFLEFIDIGRYYLKEIEAPYGYQLNPDKIYFEVVDQDVIINTMDDLIKKEVKIEKYLENIDGTLQLESNAVFEVYDAQNKLVCTFETNEYGKYFLTLPLGQYTLKQIAATEGYELAPDIILTVSEDMTLEELIIKNPQITGSLLIEKKDRDTQELILKEATFKIRNTDTNQFWEVDGQDTFKTVDGKIVIENIPYGNYELIEVEAPQGYQLLEEAYLFSITGKKIITIEAFNDMIKGSLLVEKKDLDSGKLIYEEAAFKIRNRDTNEYLTREGEEIFKTQDGKLFIDDIPYGNYELIEVMAPVGYKMAEEKYLFTIDGEEEISLVVYNEVIRGSLLIEKLDYETLQPLSGVLFGLYDQDYQLIKEYYTDLKGQILIEDLSRGLYFIKELGTLDDYELLDGFMDVDVKNNTLSTVKVTNRLKIEVPKTGTNEFFLTIVFSALCLLVGALLCNYDKNH